MLRETADKTRRLVFLPTLLDRPTPIRGYFVYQRKSSKDGWEDIRTESLNTLKAGEGYVLELHSDEVSLLMEGLLDRKALYETYGIVWGSRDFVRKDNLPQIVRGIVDFPNSELADVLGELDEEDVLSLGRKVDLSKLDSLLAEWRDSPDNSNEDHWQNLLSRNAWVFSQLTGAPVVLLQDKAYVGGKSIEDTGGGQVDYLLRNELTDNVSFIEIKTPATPICAAAYRTSGSFALDKEISGGIVQVLGYKDTFEKEFYSLRERSDRRYQSYNPRCYLIVGSTLTMDEDEVRSFELFRNALVGVQILTFDEVETRLQGIRDVLTA